MRRRILILLAGAAMLVAAAATATADTHRPAHLRGTTTAGHAIRFTADGEHITSLRVVVGTFCSLTGSTRTRVRIRSAHESHRGVFRARYTARNGIKVWIRGRIVGRHARGTITSAVDVGDNICRGATRWRAQRAKPRAASSKRPPAPPSTSTEPTA